MTWNASVVEHNCIKQGFEREESLLGIENLNDALRDRKNIRHAKEETLKVLESPGLNSWKAVMLYENYRLHIAKQWQYITCPLPSKEQWDDYNADTAKNVDNRKQKKKKKESETGIGEECKKISEKEGVMKVLNKLIFNIIDVLNCVVIVCC